MGVAAIEAGRIARVTNNRRKGNSMKESGSADASPLYDERPWGSFTVLDEGENFKVKRIEVLPGKRLSYQKHAQRAEHWMVVAGEARVTLNDEEITVTEGNTIDIPIEAKHRVENASAEKLIFIEIQRGSYLGEDDIVRFSDDFGRAE
jgi:mannose-6-phosphate isomerase-like protein (cupin superfamily)